MASLFGPGKKKPKPKASPGSLNPGDVEATRKKLLNLSTVCVVFAVVAVMLGIVMFVRSSMTLSQYESNTVEVLVPTKNIEGGTVVTASDLTTTRVPQTWIPTDALVIGMRDSDGKTITAQSAVASVAGHMALTTLTANVPISMSTIQASGQNDTLGAAIETGHVAIMVDMDPSASLSPLLKVGDYVDVVGTLTQNGTAVTDIIASNVRIVGLDSSIQATDSTSDYSRVTLSVTESQAITIRRAASLSFIMSATVAQETEDVESAATAASQEAVDGANAAAQDGTNTLASDIASDVASDVTAEAGTGAVSSLS